MIPPETEKGELVEYKGKTYRFVRLGCATDSSRCERKLPCTIIQQEFFNGEWVDKFSAMTECAPREETYIV